MPRPASATTFGILNIIFGVFGAFGIFATTVLLAATGVSKNPVVNIIRENPSYAAWMKMTIPLGALACIALLSAGIGLLCLKEWARKLSIGYGIYAILFGIAGMAVNFVFLVRPLIEKASQEHGPQAAGAVGGAVGGTLGGFFALVYPILLLVFMTRQTLIAAFKTPAEPPVLPR